jgi:hypothetical protein
LYFPEGNTDTHRSKGKQKCIQLEQQPTLVLEKLPRIPNISLPALERFHDELMLGTIWRSFSIVAIWAVALFCMSPS